MKVTVNIDCTPQEARTFFGLPDVEPMQKALMAELQVRMQQNLAAMDPETLLKTWLPVSIQSLEQFQKMFWPQFSGASDRSRSD
ncbi:MAG TPA: DUF6489 family protein [Candidatus Cybelea sp.]|nr:DUF6489 family protein [Candidatus Cybelea sp.]